MTGFDRFMFGVTLLMLAAMAAFAAPGDVTTGAGTAIYRILTQSGEVRAKSPKSTVILQGAGGTSVMANSTTATITVSSVFQDMSSYARLGGEVDFQSVTLPDYGEITVGGSGEFAGTNISNAGVNAGFYYGTWFGYGPESRVAGSDLYEANQHRFNMGNPHNTQPSFIFGNPTGARFPLFLGDDQWEWRRPLEVCGSDPATAVYDGRPGPAGPSVFCNVSGGIRSHAYDSVGINPQPAPTSFAVQLWEGAQRIAIQSWQWWTGGDSNRVYGSGTTATFTPSLKPVYSQHSSNNYINVQVRYSTASGGNRYCTAGTPINVTRTGQQGIQGPQGESGTVDYASVVTALETSSATPVTLNCSASNDEVKFRLKNVSANITIWMTCRGRIVVQEGSVYRWQFDPALMQMLLKDANDKTRVIVGTDGTVTGYKGNGTTQAFKLYSTGLVL